MVLSGSTLWIANRTSSSLTAVSALTGALLQSVSPHDLGVGRPDAEVFVGSHLFVASVGGPIAELTLGGHHVRTVRSLPCGPLATTMLASSGLTRLIELCSNGFVNVLDVATGHLLRTISSAVSGLSTATSLVVVGRYLFVTNVTANDGTDGVTQLDWTTGHLVTVLTNASNVLFGFTKPMGIASDGTNLWVANMSAEGLSSQTVTEISLRGLHYLQSVGSGYDFYQPTTVISTRLSPSKPAVVYVVNYDNATWSMVTKFTESGSSTPSFGWTMCNSNDHYKFDNPTGMVLYHGQLWVVNSGNNLLDEMDATSGSLTATFT